MGTLGIYTGGPRLRDPRHDATLWTAVMGKQFNRYLRQRNFMGRQSQSQPDVHQRTFEILDPVNYKETLSPNPAKPQE